MNYQIYKPSETLRPFIKCYWTLEGPTEAKISKQKILPDGCMEMIFHHGDLYTQFKMDGSSFIQPRCFLYGQITTTLEIAPTGNTGIFSARFHPHGLTPLLNIKVDKLANKATPLINVFGKSTEQLEKNILFSNNTIERINFIEKYFLKILGNQQNADHILNNCISEILIAKGNISVNQLAANSDTHRRKLERLFKSQVGLSPKQLSKAVRLQALIKRLHTKEFTNLTDLAYEYGYFDQAHFIKDFREFTGISPKQFFAENLQMAALFSKEA